MTAEQSNKIANMGFVSSLLVVFIHLGHLPQETGSLPWVAWYVLREMLASVAVPFFFIVSGYFLAAHFGEDGWWRRAVGKRLRTLGIPYLIWCGVPFVLFSLVWTDVAREGECMRALMKVSSIAAAFGLNMFTSPEANRPLWYVRALMIFVAVSPVLAFLLKKSRGWLLAALFALLLATNPGTLQFPDFWLGLRARIFFVFGISTEGLFYFTLGLFLRAHPLRVSRRAGTALGLCGLATGVCGLMMAAKGCPFWGYAVTLSIPPMLILVWSVIPSRKFSPLVTGSAFAIYMMHAVIIKILDELGLFGAGSWSVFVAWIEVAGLALAAAILLRRYLPSFSAVAFGGR